MLAGVDGGGFVGDGDSDATCTALLIDAVDVETLVVFGLGADFAFVCERKMARPTPAMLADVAVAAVRKGKVRGDVASPGDDAGDATAAFFSGAAFVVFCICDSTR